MDIVKILIGKRICVKPISCNVWGLDISEEECIAMKIKKLIITSFALLFSSVIFSQSTQQQCHQDFMACSRSALSMKNLFNVCADSLKQERLKCAVLGIDSTEGSSCFKNLDYLVDSNIFYDNCMNSYTINPTPLIRLCQINYGQCQAAASGR
jgi:hypothetical protein